MARYFLSAHSYSRRTVGYAILPDLKQDAYSVVDPAGVPLLNHWIQDWAGKDELGEPRSTGDVVERALLNAGPITVDEAQGKIVCTVSDSPSEHSPLHRTDSWRDVLAQSVARFLNAWSFATYRLRFWLIAPLFDRIRRRRRAHTWTSADFERAYGLVGTYFRFGVAMSPNWSVHSWFQEVAVVLNDSVAQVRRGAPVSAV